MAILIPITRIELDDSRAIYRYTQAIYESYEHRPGQWRMRQVGEHVGIVGIDRSSGEITWVLGSDWDSEQRFFNRVAVKLSQAFRKCEYPERIDYAA